MRTPPKLATMVPIQPLGSAPSPITSLLHARFAGALYAQRYLNIDSCTRHGEHSFWIEPGCGHDPFEVTESAILAAEHPEDLAACPLCPGYRPFVASVSAGVRALAALHGVGL